MTVSFKNEHNRSKFPFLLAGQERHDTHALKQASGEFALFDVFYEDGTQRSNRKVPRKALMGQEGDELARAIIEEQDAAIAQKSGKAPVAIKRVQRSGEK